jgi:hypothetical protein
MQQDAVGIEPQIAGHFRYAAAGQRFIFAND